MRRRCGFTAPGREPGRTALASSLDGLVHRHIQLAQLWSEVGFTVDNRRKRLSPEWSTWPSEWLSPGIVRHIAAPLLTVLDVGQIGVTRPAPRAAGSDPARPQTTSLPVRLFKSGEAAALVGALLVARPISGAPPSTGRSPLPSSPLVVRDPSCTRDAHENGSGRACRRLAGSQISGRL